MGFQIGFKDVIDVFLVALLLYQTFKLLKRTGAVNIFIGILAFIICWFLVSYVFKMELLGGIFDRVVSVGAFALIVLFQDEIRRFFSRIGSRRRGSIIHTLKRLFVTGSNDKEKTDFDLVQIVLACRNLAKSSTGALIILTRNNNLDFYTQSGEQINAAINSRLIETIFFKNSPLHDGALIVSDRKLKAAACILPVSKNQSIPRRLGLRHRAALGITEHSDAIAIVVSEETGHISWAVNGQLTANVKPEQLEHFLSEVMLQ
ncbi:MAG: diadenylate cyclase CdaA [Bacteroidota bacterium]|nr:diadenylate cyclase CdaA [Bacteroidota bacterium]